jgi:hypothetical protein
MTHEKIARIQTLAASCGVPCDTLIYVPDFDAAPTDDGLHRVWGPPVGIDGDTWPRFDGLRELFEESSMPEGWDGSDTRMEHVFTIDLRGLEGVRAPAGARAMMLFLSNASYNEAWEAGTSQTEVVFLDEAAVARGLCREPLPPRGDSRTEKRFTLVPIRVPAAVFAASGDDPVLGELRKAIWQAPARLGGAPIWLQGEEDGDDDWGGDDEGGDDEGGDDEGGDDDGGDGDVAAPIQAAPIPGRLAGGGFMMQFDEAFADVNLGDCGVMYVMGHGAWFQCY